MDIPKNKVILIGGNHHNGLGLVRCFGINKIFPYGIIVGMMLPMVFYKNQNIGQKHGQFRTIRISLSFCCTIFRMKLKDLLLSLTQMPPQRSSI